MTSLAPYILPLEAESGGRDFNLGAPKLSELQVDGRKITLSWTASADAERYEIYRFRPKKDKRWTLAATVEGDVLSWTDKDLKASTTYCYTVVPCRDTETGTLRGNFSVTGVSADTGR